MKAIVYRKYGPPHVLKLEEVEKPTPGDGEVLVKVHSASINAGDWHLLRGTPFLVRLIAGPLKPKHQILGTDIAGTVEAIGKNVGEFKPGDEEFGDMSRHGFGSFAEYVCVAESAALVLKPASMKFEDAAAMPSAAVTALQAIRDKGQIQPGQKVLVNGASGGVGTFAVQIAKSFGAEVTGVCSTRNVDMVRSIGADMVIDYTKEDFTKNGRHYDLIVDAAAYRSITECKPALGPEGIYVLIGGSTAQVLQALYLGPWSSMTAKKKIRSLLVKPNKEDLPFIQGLHGAGEVVPVIDRQYPLSDVPEAIRYLEDEHARGKIVITM